MALRFVRDPEAFSLQPTGKQSKRVKDASYLDWIRTLPCVVTGKTPVDAAHISYAEPRYGKLGRGKGSKESDCWAIPLHPDEHARQHGMSERAYWQSVGIDPCLIALSLWAAYPSHDKANLILRGNKSRLWHNPEHLERPDDEAR